MTETAYDTSEAADFLPLSPPTLKLALADASIQPLELARATTKAFAHDDPVEAS
jgi:hypothetical protein